MSTTNLFQPAVKEQLKARVALAGPSGAGKTYTALRFAKALAEGGKIALIDTERRSASLYADEFTFDTMDFQAPYKPDGLRDAIRAAGAAGYAVLVIDSFTHFWSGPGGVLEIVENNKKGNNTWAGWAVGTPLQQQVVDTMLTAPMHIIVCMRSKQEWAMQANAKGQQEPTRVGMGVQQRGDIEYEFTVFGELDLAHRMTITKSRCKKLADRIEPMPGEAIAEELLAWLSSGEDPNEAFVVAGWASQHEHNQAKAGLVDAVKALPDAQREAFKAQREAAGLPSLAPSSVLHKSNDVPKIEALIASLRDGTAASAGEADAAAIVDPEPERDDPKADAPSAGPTTATTQPAPTSTEPTSTIAKSRAVKANDPIGQTEFDRIKARKSLLDADYAEQFQKDLFGAGLGGFSANATKKEAAEVEGLLDVIEARHKPVWDARRRGVFAALGAFDKDMSDDVRHRFVSDATGGATESMAKLTQEQSEAIIKAAELAGGDRQPVEAQAS